MKNLNKILGISLMVLSTAAFGACPKSIRTEDGSFQMRHIVSVEDVEAGRTRDGFFSYKPDGTYFFYVYTADNYHKVTFKDKKSADTAHSQVEQCMGGDIKQEQDSGSSLVNTSLIGVSLF